jgi:hypothetical protein
MQTNFSHGPSLLLTQPREGHRAHRKEYEEGQ